MDTGTLCPDLRLTFCGLGAGCVDTMVNASHCGGCNRACGIGSTCIAGVCSGDLMVCTNRLALCGDAGTVDLSCNNEHCGSCSRACGVGLTCVGGLCATP